jgi:hypothetical protein
MFKAFSMISFQSLAMLGFIALVVVIGFFGPYLLSILLLGLIGLCWLFPRKRDDETHSSGESMIGS